MDQESCFTSETLGRLEAGLAPDLIPSAGAIIPRGREEKPGNRDPLSLFLLSLTLPGFFLSRSGPLATLPGHPAPAPSRPHLG